jgi:hypothetical protein
MTWQSVKIHQQITKVFEELLEEYLPENEGTHIDDAQTDDTQTELKPHFRHFDKDKSELIKEFLTTPCSCGKSCKNRLNFNEIAKSRREFRSLSWAEKNAFMLSQLNLFARRSNHARSARQIKTRVRQKFDYHISIDRPV